jgi:hypothetical protein
MPSCLSWIISLFRAWLGIRADIQQKQEEHTGEVIQQNWDLSAEVWRAFRCSQDSCVLIWSLNLRMIFKSFTSAPSKSRARNSRIGFSSVSSNFIPDFVM